MSFDFSIDKTRRSRIASLGFNPQALPQEPFIDCDLCSNTLFRTISDVDRYGYPGTYQMCEGCGLIFQSPHPTAEGYTEFYARWYRPLISAYKNTVEDAKSMQPEQMEYAKRLVDFLARKIKTGDNPERRRSWR